MFKFVLITVGVLFSTSGGSDSFKTYQLKGKDFTDVSLQKYETAVDRLHRKLEGKDRETPWLCLLKPIKKARKSALVDLFGYMHKSRQNAAAFVLKFGTPKSSVGRGFWETMLHDEEASFGEDIQPILRD